MATWEKEKTEKRVIDLERESDRLNIENDSLLRWNKELNANIDRLQTKIKEVESSMHGEQQEWIWKYHDQIDKVAELERINDDNERKAKAQYERLNDKYVESDKALIKYKAEVASLQKNMRIAKSVENQVSDELDKAKDDIKDLEDKLYEKN